MSELTKEQLFAVIKLIRSYPEFFEELFSPEFLLNTPYEQSEFKQKNAQLGAFDFSKLWSIGEGPHTTNMLNELKSIIEKVKNNPNAYNRWRNIVDSSIVRGGDGVKYRVEERDALSDFLKSPVSNDAEFSKNLGEFLSKNRPLLSQFAQFYTKNKLDVKGSILSDSKKAKVSSSAKDAIREKREWLGEYRALSEEIANTLKEFAITKDVDDKKLLNLIVASIKTKSNYFSSQQRSPIMDQSFARLFDGAIKQLVIAVRSKYKTDLGMYNACMPHLVSSTVLDRDLFVEYFLNAPEFIKTDDGKFQLTMPTSFKGGCDISFKVNAGRLEISKDIKSFVGAQEDIPGPGLAMNAQGGYYTTAEALLAATATIIPMGTVPFSVPNRSSKDSTAFAPTRAFFNHGNSLTMQSVTFDKAASMQEVDIKGTVTKDDEIQMTFAVALGKANAKVTLTNIGPFNKVPAQKSITKANRNPNDTTYKFNIHDLLGLPSDVNIGVVPIGTVLYPDPVDPNRISSDVISIKLINGGDYTVDYIDASREYYNFDPTSKIRSTEMGFICTIYSAPGVPVSQVVFTLDDLDFKLGRNKIYPKFNFMVPTQQICQELLKQGWQVNTPEVVWKTDKFMRTLAMIIKEINKYVQKNLIGFPDKDLSLDIAEETIRAKIAEIESHMAKSEKVDHEKFKDLALEKAKLSVIQKRLQDPQATRLSQKPRN